MIRMDCAKPQQIRMAAIFRLEPLFLPAAHLNPLPRRSVLDPYRRATHAPDRVIRRNDVYLNGRQIGSAGNLKTGAFNMNTIRDWPLSSNLVPPSLIALRLTRRVVSHSPSGARAASCSLCRQL